MPLHRLHPDFRIREGRGGVGRMLNKNTSGTTGGKGEVPSQGTGPISPLFSRAQFLVCFGASQQDSSGYSLAKEGWPRHQVNGPVPLEARPGMSGANVSPIGRNKEEWFVQLPIIGGLNQPPRLHPLRRLRGIFLMGAATPPCPRRGLRLSLQLFSMPPCPAKDVGHGKPVPGGEFGLTFRFHDIPADEA